MTRVFEIYGTDLTAEARKEFCKIAGIDSIEEGNYDTFPIAVVEFEDDNEEE